MDYRQILQEIVMLANDFPYYSSRYIGLLTCLQLTFAMSICFHVVGSGKAEVDVELLVQLFEELERKLYAKI